MFKQLKNLGGKLVFHFSHNDMDGYAPQVLSKLYGIEVVEYHHCGYDNFDQKLEKVLQPFWDDTNEFRDDFAILITDISPNPKNIEALARLYSDGITVVLLDHHDTAKWIAEKYPEWTFIESEIDGVKTSATSIYHQYLIEKDLVPNGLGGSRRPAEFVEYVRAYDTWDWSHTGNIYAKELNNILYTVSPEKWVKWQLEKLKFPKDRHAEFGHSETEAILAKVESDKEADYIRKCANRMERTTWYVDGVGYKIGFVYAEQFVSTVGNELNKLNPELDLIMIIDMGKEKGSLRTIHDHIHVGEISKIAYGGGGHQKAAGFEFGRPNFHDVITA